MCACLRSRDLLLGLLSLPLPVLACGGNLSVLPMPEQPQQQLWLLRTHATDAGTPATLRVSAGSEPWIALEDSAALRLPPDPFAVRSADGRRWLPLSAVPGLDYQLDACAQAGLKAIADALEF